MQYEKPTAPAPRAPAKPAERVGQVSDPRRGPVIIGGGSALYRDVLSIACRGLVDPRKV